MADFQDAFSYAGGSTLNSANADYTRYDDGDTAALYTTGSAVDWNSNGSSSEFIVYKYTAISPGATQYAEAVISTGGSFSRGSGVCVRVQSSTNCYILYITSARLTMGKVVSGTYTEFAGVNGTYTGGPYTLRLEVDANFNLTGYIGGVSTLTFDDTGDTYASGGTGIGGCAEDSVTIDSFDTGDLVTSGAEDVAAAMTALIPTMSAALARNGEVALVTRGFTLVLDSDQPITVVTFEDGVQGAVLDASATYCDVVGYTTPQGPPTSSPARNGAMIDPVPSFVCGYDDRDYAYGGDGNPANSTSGTAYDSTKNVGLTIAAGTPVDVTPPAGSYVSFCVASSCTGTPPDPGDNPLERWVPFPIMDSAFAPADASITHTPWAYGPTKQTEHYDTSAYDTATDSQLGADLEAVHSYFSATLLAAIKTDMAALWCDHMSHHFSRFCHPLLDMPGTGYGGDTLEYGRELSRRVSEALTMLQSDLADAELRRAVVRQGINAYGARTNGMDIGPNGGHGQGRKPLWIAAWQLLGQPASLDPFADDTLNINEDGQSFTALQTGGTVNNGYGNRLDGTALVAGDPAWGINHADTAANDDYDYTTPDSNGTYARINLPQWHLTAWAIRKLFGSLANAETAWNHDPFFRIVEAFHTEYSAHGSTHAHATALWDDATIGYSVDTPSHSAVAAMTGLVPTMAIAMVTGHGATCAMTGLLPTMLAYALKGGTSFGDGGRNQQQRVRRIAAHMRQTRARR